MMSPLILGLLLHAYGRRTPFENTDLATIKEAIRFLVMADLIEQEEGDIYKATDRGIFHVKALLALPLPVQIWVTPTEDTFG